MRLDRHRAPARLLGILVVLLLVGLGIALVASWFTPRPGGDGPAGPGSALELAAVERVVDGDTLVVRLDGAVERVRLIGIDAPEQARPSDGIAAECWASEATEAHATLVDGSEVRLERDVSDRDRFGRLLRHAWVRVGGEWGLLSERLVALGAAEARSYPPDVSRDEDLDAAERRARGAGAGLWGACDRG